MTDTATNVQPLAAPTTPAPIHQFTLICDDIRQEMGGKTSLMGLYDHHIVVPELPFTLPKVCFYTRFTNITGKFKFGFAITAPGGEKRQIIDGSDVEIPAGANEGTFNVIASPFDAQAEGVHEVNISLEQGDTKYEYVYKFAISNAQRLQAEYEARTAQLEAAPIEIGEQAPAEVVPTEIVPETPVQ